MTPGETAMIVTAITTFRPDWTAHGVRAALDQLDTTAPADRILTACVQLATDPRVLTPGAIPHRLPALLTHRADAARPAPNDPDHTCAICRKPYDLCRRSDIGADGRHDFVSQTDHAKQIRRP